MRIAATHVNTSHRAVFAAEHPVENYHTGAGFFSALAKMGTASLMHGLKAGATSTVRSLAKGKSLTDALHGGLASGGHAALHHAIHGKGFKKGPARKAKRARPHSRAVPALHWEVGAY